jgi:luciferase family oxidoreductase group 1
MAAERGLAFAFAHHINAGPAVDSLRIYRERFRPSPSLGAPRALIAVSAICADSNGEAEVLASSAELSMALFKQGRPLDFLPSVEEAAAYPYSDFERELIRSGRGGMFIGAPETVRARITRLAEDAGVDEIMITTMVHSHEARKRSYAHLAEAFSIPSPGA